MDIKRKIMNFARKFMSGHHDYDHYLRAAVFARRIWEKEGGDWEIISAAIWLHDIGRSKSVKNHPQIGAEMARDFLTRIGFPPEKLRAVVDAIRLHDEYGGQRTIEEKIVYDADRLDCFTYSGFIRCFLEPYKVENITSFSTLVNVAANYLKKAFENLNTVKARHIAHYYKDSFLDEFFEKLKAEMS